MGAIKPEPRIRVEYGYNPQVHVNAAFNIEMLMQRDLFVKMGSQIEKNFKSKVIDYEVMPIGGSSTRKKEIELWVFTPESLKELLDTSLDQDDQTINRLASKLGRVIYQKSLIAKK